MREFREIWLYDARNSLKHINNFVLFWSFVYRACWQHVNITDFPHYYRPAQGPTQPPVQWVLRPFPGGKAAGA